MGSGCAGLESPKVPVTATASEDADPDWRRGHTQVPSGGASIGWYSLKKNQLATPSANKIPPGLDRWAMGPRRYAQQKDQILELCSDGVPANFYVKVVEIAAVRISPSQYLIRGRIEKSPWRNPADTWVNILMREHDFKRKNMWNAVKDDQYGSPWSADPVEDATAEANPSKPPDHSFEQWKAAMIKVIDKDADDHEAALASICDKSEKLKTSGGGGSFKIYWESQNHEALEIDGSTLKPAGGIVSEQWEMGGDRISCGTKRWEIKNNHLRVDGDGNRDHGWEISGNTIKKNGAMDRFELSGNRVTLNCHSGNTMSKVGKELKIEGGQIDIKTLAFAFVAMGLIVPE